LSIQQVVQATQAAHPGLSFEESWRIAAAESPELFDWAVHFYEDLLHVENLGFETDQFDFG
jgi:hypothetical protein